MEDLIRRMNQAEEKGDKLKEKFDKKWFKKKDILDKWEEYSKTVENFFVEYYELKREYDLKRKPKMSELAHYGDLFTIEEFSEYCITGGFIDYDGFGLYANKTQQSDISVKPSSFIKYPQRKDFTHIIWFNR